MEGLLRERSIAVVLGTRPEMIKMMPLLKLLGDRGRMIHTGQHFDDDLSGQFLRGARPRCAVAAPRGRWPARGAPRSVTPRCSLEEHFNADPPEVVVVHGDTNAALAGALAANASGIPLIHVESGLRSFDRAMPEEHNRIVVDHLADLCLAPTETNRANLAAEGIGGDRVILTGNTVVDAVLELLPPPPEQHAVLARHGLEPGRYVLSTLHRPENVDDPEVLGMILSELGRCDLPVLLPLHPRTRASIEDNGLSGLLAKVQVLAPIGLHRVPEPGGQLGAPRVGLRRRAGGGQRPEATGAGGPELHRAARDPGHVRAARPPGAARRRLDRAAPGSGPAAAQPAADAALALRRRDGIAAVVRGDHDAPLPPDLLEARRVVVAPAQEERA